MLFVFDRDGVINVDSPDYIKNPDEWQPIPGAVEAIADLCQSGHSVAIATNQSGVGRGLYDLETLSKIHQKMISLIESAGGKIERLIFCPHHPDEGCDCRKPKPGMLLRLFAELKVEPDDACYIGDSWRDYQAAESAGCAFVLVKTGNGEKTLLEHPEMTQHAQVFADVAAYVNAYLKSE